MTKKSKTIVLVIIVVASVAMIFKRTRNSLPRTTDHHASHQTQP